MYSFNITQMAAWTVMTADNRGNRGAIGRPVQWSKGGGRGLHHEEQWCWRE